jgi:hypothetical protein
VFQQAHSNYTQYVLSDDQHYLTETTSPFQDLTSLAITGAGKAVVSCTNSETGLAFINVVNLTLHDVAFYDCYSLRNSTSRKYNVSNLKSSFHLYQFHAALYLYKCSDITMTSLVVAGSPQVTGVAIYNTIGTNIIKDSIFTSNRLESAELAEHPGGGGAYVEFTFCIPGDDSCDDFDDSIAASNSDGKFHFHNVTFRLNRASDILNTQESDTHIVPFKRIHNGFGKGGGLAIIIKGNASNNTFDVTECTFEENEAIWGGGLLVEYQDHSSSNFVIIRDSIFLNNRLLQDGSMESTGGGIRVGQYVYDSLTLPNFARNKVLVTGCEFSNNSALNGGGISFFPARQMATATDHVFQMIVHDTTFTNNQAKVGAAIEATLFSLFLKGRLPSLIINDSRFISNSIHSYKASIHEVGVGAVYSNRVPIHFSNDIEFENNTGSGLAIVGAAANFSNSTALFIANRGRFGGGINILGAAFLVINTFTTMKFVGNEAEVNGGAIANVFIERENFRSYPNCFIRHTEPFLQPHDWGANLSFIDNAATMLGNSIYTTSVHPCAWAGGSGVSQRSQVLCWRGWEYVRDGSQVDCHSENQINTDSGIVTWLSDANGTVTAFPGQEFELPLVIKDDLETPVENKTVFSAVSLESNVSHVNPRYDYISGRYIQLDGVGGNSVTLQLNSNNERAWEIGIEVQLLTCPPGKVQSHEYFELIDPANSTCVCNENHTYSGLLHCSTENVYMTNGYWFGKIDGYDDMVASLCLPGFCHMEGEASKRTMPSSDDELDEQLCGLENRRGILCGRCVEGLGPSVNTKTFTCIKCSTVLKDVFLYILSIYLPLFLLFVLIIMFSVRLATGPANAFIFYAQYVSSTFDLNADSHIPINLITSHDEILLQLYQVPYGVFNLDFLETFVRPLCFGTGLGNLDVLQLEYLIAFFPLLMIIGMVIIVKIKDSRFFGRCLCRRPSWRFLRRWEVNKSLLHAFSAFLLLSYTKFSLTSSYIVNIHPFYNATGQEVGEERAYFDGTYTSIDTEYLYRYRIPGIIVLIVIAVFPLLLFGYPVVWFEKCIIKVDFLWRWYPADKVQIFLDTFQGCYRDDRRFFAGMYFAFRLTINASYIIVNTWLEQFVVQQVVCTVFVFIIAVCWPYREEKWYVNYVDLFIFTNLAIVNALSLYLFVYAKLTPILTELPLWPFIMQYILVFMPLIYMVVYLIWYIMPVKLKEILMKILMTPANILKRRRKRRHERMTLLGPSEGPTTSRSTLSKNQNKHTITELSFPNTEVESEGESEESTVAGSGSDDDLQAILTRAETRNTYRSTNESPSITPYQQWVKEAKLSSRRRGQYHSEPEAPKDYQTNLLVDVDTPKTADRESGIQSGSVGVTERNGKHHVSTYGSTDSTHAELHYT